MSRDEERADEIRREQQIGRLVRIQPFGKGWWMGAVLLTICIILLGGGYYLATVHAAWQYGEVVGFLAAGTLITLTVGCLFVRSTMRSTEQLRRLKRERPGAKIIPITRKPH